MSPTDKIPDWVKKGNVTLQNYDLRALWYGREVKAWSDNWPFLSHKSEYQSTADDLAWELYFRDHLEEEGL